MTAKDRRADRHAGGGETSVSARLDPDDFRRFEAVRKRLGLPSKRKAVIAAIRDWLDKHAPETTEPTGGKQ